MFTNGSFLCKYICKCNISSDLVRTRDLLIMELEFL